LGNTAGFKSKVTLRFRAARRVSFFLSFACALFGVDVMREMDLLDDIDDEVRDREGFLGLEDFGDEC
jgi:hypothetical protein